ncbi:MAG TPA: sialidase family protein [Ktedonobacteraceae bacterium]|nr:sialidase family protein [Ktedonobacteraceae bacterium]
MSIHHDTENEREGQLQGSPSEQEQEMRQGEVAPARQPSLPSSPRPPDRPWFIVLLVTIIVVLLAAGSIGTVALVQLSRQHATIGTPTPGPILTTQPTATAQPLPTATPFPAGQWIQVLAGYHVTEILAAPSRPNVLYACAIAPGVPTGNQSVQTILRSADSGTTWQNIGARVRMGRSCELVINPTDSYEIYVATSPNVSGNLAASVLEHTSNGGDSWETLHPTVVVPGLNTTLFWQGTQLRLVHNRLYSVQALPLLSSPTPQGTRGWYPSTLARILTSLDGGHTWQVLDTQLAASGQWAEAYTVNPAQPTLFYELTYVPTEPGTAFPSLELYRSIDGGKTWQPIAEHLPWLAPLSPATILNGSTNPAVIYLTNTRCPVAQALRVDSRLPVHPLAGSPFSMCMSRDSGKNWKTLLSPSQFAQTMGGGAVDPQGRLYTQVTTPDSVAIWRYNPVTDLWEKVTQAPGVGNLLAGTPPVANGSTVLWFLRTDGPPALYRYLI